MSSSIHAFLLLVLFVGCFNSSTSSSDDSSPNGISHYHLDDSNLNRIFIFISNDLGPGSADFYFTTNFNKNEIHLKPGQSFSFSTNSETINGSLKWSTLYANIELYNSRTEGDHQKIMWSVRKDGIYHSWDNINWDKKANWVHY